MKRLIIYTTIMILVLGSCYPDGPQYYEELDIVLTNYEKDYNFSSSGTYAMPDSIVKITGNIDEGEDPEFVKEPYNKMIIDKIESNMTAFGWSRVEDPSTADLVLFPATWTNTTVYYWYDYWCWYYYYYCGWGYYWYPSVSSYTTGTFVMHLIADGEKFVEPSKVWTAAINGLLSGTQNVDRINNAIDQAFGQSPYLIIK